MGHASSPSFPHHSPNGSNPPELERQKIQRAWQQRDNHKNGRCYSRCSQLRAGRTELPKPDALLRPICSMGKGTGSAELLGARMHALFTIIWGLSSQRTLPVSAGLPIVMLFAFFGVLPQGPLKRKPRGAKAAYVLADEDEAQEQDPMLPNSQASDNHEDNGLLAPPLRTKPPLAHSAAPMIWLRALCQNLQRSRSLFIP